MKSLDIHSELSKVTEMMSLVSIDNTLLSSFSAKVNINCTDNHEKPHEAFVTEGKFVFFRG